MASCISAEEVDGTHSIDLLRKENQMSKKGIKIAAVRIDGKIVEPIDKDGAIIKVTRTQREVLRNYKDPEYIQEIKKAFSNDHIVADDFIVIKNGIQVFPK